VASQLISPMKQLAVMKEKLGEMKTERGRPVGAQIQCIRYAYYPSSAYGMRGDISTAIIPIVGKSIHVMLHMSPHMRLVE
jgi:hypothetical protein